MSVEQVITASIHAEKIRMEMNRLAATLPEYDVVMSMRGVGTKLGPQLMAEIGDVSRFTHREAITAFAGVDPGVDESGQRRRKSNGSSKCGSPRLRRTLFLVMDSLLKTKPVDDPVYQFLDRKRSEGKLYKVYMTAGANKFLRIYYGKVKEHLHNLEKEAELQSSVETAETVSAENQNPVQTLVS
jgi:transposase